MQLTGSFVWSDQAQKPMSCEEAEAFPTFQTDFASHQGLFPFASFELQTSFLRFWSKGPRPPKDVQHQKGSTSLSL